MAPSELETLYSLENLPRLVAGVSIDLNLPDDLYVESCTVDENGVPHFIIKVKEPTASR